MRKTDQKSEKAEVKNAQDLWLEIQKLSAESRIMAFDILLARYGRHTGKFIMMLAGADFIKIDFRGGIKINEAKRGHIFETNPGCGK